MLFNHCSDLPHSFLSKSHDHDPIVIPNPAHSFLSSMSLGSNNVRGTRGQPWDAAATITVAQALEFARDSDDHAQDPHVTSVLENAIRDIWSKIERAPTSYILTRDEFAVFNYFQARFTGQPLAIAARKRYWDHLELTNGAS